MASRTSFHPWSDFVSLKLSPSTWPRSAKRVGGLRQTTFGSPEQVLNYLGPYTHRVAISNNRLLGIENGRVTFRWKDYPHHDDHNFDRFDISIR